MKPKKRMDRRKALSHILSISSDPDFITGAKEVLARKPFDYGLRSDKSQVRYENGRLIAIRVLQSSLCFLVMLALWAIPALAQQKWWALVRGEGDVFSTCTDHPPVESPAKWHEGALANGWPAQIVDQGDEVNVYTISDGKQIKVSYFRTQDACHKAAQANIDENAKMDKYR
jgi:hypothetical protein